MENTQQLLDKKANIVVEVIKKNKKNEPKIFPSLMLVDKEAFDNDEHTKFIMKEFWASSNNKIIVARKQDTQAIVGYAIFSVCDLQDKRFGKKWFPSVYLMRIGVRLLCQRQGIGRKLVSYLMETYPTHALSLDVGTDNEKGVNFYQRMGMKIQKLYMSPNQDEFALFETPLDKQGNKIKEGEDTETIQPYFNDIEDYKVYHLFMESQKIIEQADLKKSEVIKIEVKTETCNNQQTKITIQDKSLKTPNRETSPASDETQSSANTNISNKNKVENQDKQKTELKMNVNAPAFVMNVNAKAWTPSFKV